MKHGRRLRAIEGGLTAKQAIIMWMEEAHQFSYPLAYARWLSQQPRHAYPLNRMANQMAAAVREGRSGQPRRAAEGTLKSALRDLCFLFFLEQAAVSHAHHELEKLELRLALVKAQFDSFLQQQAHHRHLLIASLETLVPDDPGEPRVRALAQVRESAESLRDAAADWASAEQEARREVASLRGVSKLIAERYFDSHSVLYPAQEEAPDAADQFLAELRALYQESVGGTPVTEEELIHRVFEPRSDCEDSQHWLETAQALEPEVEKGVANRVKLLVVLAQAEALHEVREGDREYRLLMEHRDLVLAG